MPFDNSTLTEFDQDTATLIRAKEILIKDGWCICALVNSQGQHCINGAILQTSGRSFGDITTDRLISRVATALGFIDCADSWNVLVTFNNRQTSVKPVLELLDKAIAHPHP